MDPRRKLPQGPSHDASIPGTIGPHHLHKSSPTTAVHDDDGDGPHDYWVVITGDDDDLPGINGGILVLAATTANDYDLAQRKGTSMSRTAVIAGVGPGLGASLARRLAAEGCTIGLLSRTMDFTEGLAAELSAQGSTTLAMATDIADEAAVATSFAQIRQQLGPVDVLVNHASASAWKGLLEVSAEEMERAWRVSVLGAFLCSREAARDMLAGDGGTILFTGATSGVRGRAGAIDFSSAKFGMRGLADSMARELWPQGIHVAHIIVDGMIDTASLRQNYQLAEDEALLDPEDIAQVYWDLVTQRRGAWSFEVDVRPHREAFFE